MSVLYEERLSDSSFIETIWRTQVTSDGYEMVAAETGWDMVVIRQGRSVQLCVSGPMTKAVSLNHAEGSEHIGIRFKLGTFISCLPASHLVDDGAVLPEANQKSFWLRGYAWEYPSFENVETFINRLIRGGLLCRDDVIESALQGRPQDISLRSIQRRFLRVTGLTQRTICSIERAQQAASLLQNGLPILEVVYQAGYADQQTMTKSLKHFLGYTPGQLAHIRGDE